MPLLTVQNAQLAFGHVALLDKVSFSLDNKEVVGLIGRNGAGKSSLLKAIAGVHKLDDGRIVYQDGIKLAYVPQEPVFDGDHTVFEAVAEGLGDIKNALKAYHDAIHALTLDASDEAAMDAMSAAQQAIEAADGWGFDQMIQTTLTHLGLDEHKKINELSGGWKKRVALARALASTPDVLILDEPTNHLDVNAIEWLESLIGNFQGSVLLITHDRRFLDNVCNRIIELDRGQLNNYVGSFASYQAKKIEELAIEDEQNRVFDKAKAQEEVWIRRGVKARLKRNMGRVKRLEELRSKRAERRERMGQVNFQLSAGDKSGKLVAELTNVSKGYNGRTLINDFTSRIMRGDKIGLIGENGAGKTTLLKMILGELQPDTGTVEQGTKQSIAYFDQFRTALDDEMSLMDVISPGADFITINGQQKHVISYLEDFLFAAERSRSPVKSLSGGERNRLLLARLFSKEANILVLDEPTNDLDIDTLELLEGLLDAYTGTVFLVSHDRTFIDNVVTQVIVSEQNGVWQEYAGGYEDWQNTKKRMAELATSTNKTAPKPSAPAASTNTKKPSEKANKLNYNESRELAALPEALQQLEQEQAALTAELSDGSLYVNAPEKAVIISNRLSDIDALILEKMTRWEVLESKQA
jgi:ATP-binding cassette subfamily F protein uup